MSAVERRNELIRILETRRKDTYDNLAFELGVSKSTIRRDIEALTRDYPITTIPGNGGGVMVEEWYHPHKNIFSRKHTETLQALMEGADEYTKEVLAEILREYGNRRVAV